MTNPITPPPNLTDKWNNLPLSTEEIFVIAAQWGADQELAACCEWVSKYLPYLGDFPMPEDKLRTARRPEPPSLKERALKGFDDISQFALGELEGTSVYEEYKKIADTVRQALEAL